VPLHHPHFHGRHPVHHPLHHPAPPHHP
jgi:hypothetical protein